MKKFANGFARLVFGLCVVLTAPAWALGDAAVQKDAAPKVGAAKEAAAAADKKADPKCEGLTLTGEKFLDMFHTIAMHGDLTDVPFIEKTLETKFDVRYSDGGDENHPRYKRAYHKSNIVAGNPVEVSLMYDVEREQGLQKKFVARMDFEGAIFNCLKIEKKVFTKKFGDQFVDGFISGGGPIQSESKNLGKIGNNGTAIVVANHFDWRTEDKFLDSAQIRQLTNK